MLANIKPEDLPNIDVLNHKPHSLQDASYNCIGFAAETPGVELENWYPIDLEGFVWPIPNPKKRDVDEFIRAFRTLRYEPCDNGDPEPGFEKVVFYGDKIRNETEVLHASRQLKDGTWTSKLGPDEDIIHQNVNDVADGMYGDVLQFMKRERL